MTEHGIVPIDFAFINFYPFQQTIAKPGVTRAEAIENIDIGGPAGARSAGKNHRSVTVVVDPGDYPAVLADLETLGEVTLARRERLAAKAYFHTCCYDAEYLSDGGYVGFFGQRVVTCKYGENTSQSPAHLYSRGSDDPLALDEFQVEEGTPLSYNNMCDIDRLIQTITHIAAAYDVNFGTAPAIAVGVKHGNACGAAVDRDLRDVASNVMAGDLRAIFGGLVMTNFGVDAAVAELLSVQKLDGIIAPRFTSEAIAMLRRKKDKCRFVVNAALAALSAESLDRAPRFRYVRGCFLAQPNYTFVPRLRGAEIDKFGPVGIDYEADMLLAWAIGATSNSNTITLVKGGMLIGNAVGQQDRVGAAELAIKRAHDAKHDVVGAVAYSDSFFPFPDGPKALIDAGVCAIFTSRGSVNDQKTIDLCMESNVALYMIPDALGRGFFGH